MQEFYSSSFGSVSKQEVFKDLLESVVNVGAKYGCRVAIMQELLQKMSRDLPNFITLQLIIAESVVDIVEKREQLESDASKTSNAS